MHIRKTQILLALLVLCAIGCKRNCQDLPSTFKDYREAIEQVEKAAFKIDETIRTPESTWISSATFSSCDGKKGYFFLRVKDKKYLYYDVPVELWEGFKSAKSKGGYYNQNMKGRFKMPI